MSAGEVIIAVTVAVLGSSGLTTVLNRIFSKKDKKDAYKQAIMYCLLSNLQAEARRIIERGYVNRLEYNQFCDMYRTYKACGGDGYADELRNQVDEIARLTLQGGMIK